MNTSGKVLLEPRFDEIFFTKNGAVGCEYIEEADYEKLMIYGIDKSGDIFLNINKELDKKFIDNVIDFWPLDDALFGFQYSNWDSLELSGIFNEYGKVIIPPEYSEVEIISNNIIRAFHGAHYEEYDSAGYKLYGWKVFNSYGEMIVDESVKLDYDKKENDAIEFKTMNGKIITINKYGKICSL